MPKVLVEVDEQEFIVAPVGEVHGEVEFWQPRLRGIIHKRKLSKKLFFLDVAFMQLKQHPPSQHHQPTPEESLASSDPEGFQLSHWQEEREEQDEMQHDPLHQDGDTHPIVVPSKLEIIAKVPQHTLKELDTLWHSVHLGSVAKITGHLEISERKKKKEEKNPAAVEGQQHKDALAQDESMKKKQWTAILHCATIETIEPWQGKHTFQPIPGSAEIHTSPSKHPHDQPQPQQQQQQRKHPRSPSEAVNTTAPKRVEDTPDSKDVATRQPCKFWLNSGKCHKESCDLWHEHDITKLKIARRQWVEERKQAKRQISHHADDPHRSTTKHQHRERSLHFAQWLLQTFTRASLAAGTGVLDIAGGRGDLSFELQTRQGIPSTIIDPKPDKGFRKWQRRWLKEFKKKTKQNEQQAQHPTHLERNENGKDVGGEEIEAEAEVDSEEDDDEEESSRVEGTLPEEGFVPTRHEYPLQTTTASRIQAMMDDTLVGHHRQLFDQASILVGLHPDQATEPIVRMALRLGKPFAVIPCCVFSRENPHRRLPRGQQQNTAVVGEEEKSKDEQDQKGQGEGKGEEDKATRPVTSYDDFVQWLMTLHPGIETTWLNFEGMNRVVYWQGPNETEQQPSSSSPATQL
ncbi:hypothetical protein DFQ26_001503 [Actinomortierella ambigua]|nr:hypothetical protein DFQ26_001503 [Actinomortierella ambigua]